MESSNNTGKVMGALLVGAAIGGILGVLFAPDKGSRTRRKIMSKGEDLTDSLKDKLDDFVEGFKEEVETIKEKTHDYTHNGHIDHEKKKYAK